MKVAWAAPGLAASHDSPDRAPCPAEVGGGDAVCLGSGSDRPQPSTGTLPVPGRLTTPKHLLADGAARGDREQIYRCSATSAARPASSGRHRGSTNGLRFTVCVVNRLSRFRNLSDRVPAYLARIGADPQDDEDTRASKALLVLISVLILPVALLWAVLYLSFGSPVGWVPLVYFVTLLAAIVVFSRTRDFARFLFVGQVAILLAPTLSMIPLGGFLDSGGVGLWGILAPLGALVFSDVRTAARWYAAYLVVFLGSGIAGELLGGSSGVPEWFTSTMLALNVTVGGTIVFTLLAVFAAQRRNALAALREEQARAEGLLLNILPRSIADRLKAETQTIADQFS